MVLTVDYFYPDCPNCGFPGDMVTIRAKGQKSAGNGVVPDMWRCVRCEDAFETPDGCLWDDLSDAPPIVAQLYLDVEICGRSPKQAASLRRIPTDSVKRMVREGKSYVSRENRMNREIDE